MPVWMPRWVFVSLAIAAAVLVVALGYRQDSQRLRVSQERDLRELATGLRAALASTEALQKRSVRPPRTSSGGDTLEFTIGRPVLLGAKAPTAANLFWDSLCQEKLADPTGREAERRLGLVPARVWTLDRVRVYVDKERGGLWRADGDLESVLLASQVDALVIRADSVADRRPGYLIELAGTWNVDPGTAIRRKLYRYLPPREAVSG